MASANVDLVRSIYAAWERGDFSSVEWAHPEIEWVIADGPEPGSWIGFAGLAEGWRGFLSTWEEYRGEADEYREFDGERVLVSVRRSGRGKGKRGRARSDAVEGGGPVLGPRRQGDEDRQLLRPRTCARRPRPRPRGWLMASANVNLVRSIYADWACGEFSGTEWADPEIEFVIADGPSPSSQHGRRAMAEAWGDLLSVWQDYRAVAEGYCDLDDGRVLVLTAFSARGRTSNIQVSQVLARGVSLMHVHDGKVTKLVLYFNRGHGLADLGLAQETG